MSNQINNGGPVIPMAWNGQRSHEGILLRDYFAASALQGMMAQFDPENKSEHHVAKWSYKAADAMLKEREAKP